MQTSPAAPPDAPTPVSALPTPLLLRAPEAAALMGQSLSSFHRFVAQGLLPQPVKIGGATRWKRSDLEAAVAAMPPAGHRRPRGRAAHKAREARL